MAAHSLWLVPARHGPARATLRQTIERLAGRFGTPVFDPHVTLLGGLEGAFEALSTAAHRLATVIPPCEIALGEIVSRRSYHQRLVAVVAPTPELEGAHSRAVASFSGEASAYWPHLSLAYGDLDEGATAELAAMATAAGVSGLCFDAAALELWRTDGDVGAWRRISSFELWPGRAR